MPTTPTPWRLIHHDASAADLNMATDAALLEGAGAAPPTLRFYGWQPPAVSLGIDQEWELLDEAACAAHGWSLVRRPTAGRVLLHADDLSFSLILPADHPLAADPTALLRAINGGLQQLGLKPDKVKTYYADLGPTGDAAFDGPDGSNIIVGQRTLLATCLAQSAQGTLLQGTLPLSGDITRVARALYVDLPGQRMAIENRLRYRATTLLQCANVRLSAAEAAAQLTAGLARTLQAAFTPAPLTPNENARAAVLRDTKYGTRAWLERT